MIKLISAFDEQRGIGFQNDLLIKIPDDLKRFQSLTKTHNVVMGRKTYESIGKPLPNRFNWVVTTNPFYKSNSSLFLVHKPELILSYQKKHPQQDFWIIGGAQMYQFFLPYADELYLTMIHHTFSSDVSFPPFQRDLFELMHQEDHVYDGHDKPIPYSFMDFRRKQ